MRRSVLRGVLRRHEAGDEREAMHLRAMLTLLDADDPCSRSQMEPGHFTASAFVLSRDGARLLMIFHSKLHRWLQPGGHIDRSDASVVAAARREVAEETGVRQLLLAPGHPELLDVDVHQIPANPRRGEAAHAHYDVRVLFRALSDDFEAGSDALDARWVALDEVMGLDTDESVRRAVRKIMLWSRRVEDPSQQLDFPATGRNREPILTVLREVVRPGDRLLEVASGSGQHASWLASQLPLAWWQLSDVEPQHLVALEARWRADGMPGAVRPPVRLDVTEPVWPVETADVVFVSNLTHPAPWECTVGLLAGARRLLSPRGRLVIYGPFMVGGEHTSPGNASFHARLRARDPRLGLRDVSRVDGEATRHGLVLTRRIPMPANNQVLILEPGGAE